MSKPTAESQAETERFLLQPPEVSFFIACLVTVNQLRGLERAFQAGDIAENAFLDKAQILIRYLSETVTITERFDIVLPVVSPGQFAPCFWRWFNWWEDYFRGLTQAQIGQIERLGRELSLTVNSYRPKDHWLSCPSTPPFTLHEKPKAAGKN